MKTIANIALWFAVIFNTVYFIRVVWALCHGNALRLLDPLIYFEAGYYVMINVVCLLVTFLAAIVIVVVAAINVSK